MASLDAVRARAVMGLEHISNFEPTYLFRVFLGGGGLFLTQHRELYLNTKALIIQSLANNKVTPYIVYIPKSKSTVPYLQIIN